MKPDRQKGQAKAPREARPPARSRAEDPEPSVGHIGVLVWLFVALAILLFWGMNYLDHHAGGFNPQVYQRFASSNELVRLVPFDPVRDKINKGLAVYNRPTCVTCHGAGGAGAPGQFPPLANSEWVVAKDPGRIIRIVLDGAAGPMTVAGVTYNGAMVPWRPSLNDEEIALVLSYVRNSWGNNAPPVTTEEVAKIRKETEGRATPWTQDELLKIPLKE
jgi:mono/diheme cytochrome c family protein